MADIVERLRGAASVEDAGPGVCRVLIYEAREAADTITTLRDEVKHLKAMLQSEYQEGHHDGYEKGTAVMADLPTVKDVRGILKGYEQVDELTTLRAEVERLGKALRQADVYLGYGSPASARETIRAALTQENSNG